jgi:phospholysine phosphohistidine inorganic pyrophosphate phosphatase
MRGVLFDMDGVLYNSDMAIPGAAETVGWLRENRIPLLFVTNTSSRDRVALAQKLRGFGIEATVDEILTPASATADWLRQNRETGPVALFVRPAAQREFLGLPCLEDEAADTSAVSHVIIGDLGSHWDYKTLNRAFRLLYHNPHAKLVALGMTRYWLASDGISLDVAPFVAALQNATGREPLVFGKPAAHFFHAATARMGFAPGEVLMVGDDVEADVLGAQLAGLRGALVRTGKFRPADLEGRLTMPDVVLDSIANLPDCWKAGLLPKLG